MVTAKKPIIFISLPRSGLNWTRYCIEHFSRQPTPGEPRLVAKTDNNDYIISREHFLKKRSRSLEDYEKSVLLIRSYKESLFRYADGDFNKMEDFCTNIEAFDAYTGPKIVEYYEDIILDFAPVGRILDFMEIEWSLDGIDLEAFRRDSIARYTESGRNISHTKSDVNNLEFHSGHLDIAKKRRIDDHFKSRLGPLFDRYLSRYSSPNHGQSLTEK